MSIYLKKIGGGLVGTKDGAKKTTTLEVHLESKQTVFRFEVILQTHNAQVLKKLASTMYI